MSNKRTPVQYVDGKPKLVQTRSIEDLEKNGIPYIPWESLVYQVTNGEIRPKERFRNLSPETLEKLGGMPYAMRQLDPKADTPIEEQEPMWQQVLDVSKTGYIGHTGEKWKPNPPGGPTDQIALTKAEEEKISSELERLDLITEPTHGHILPTDRNIIHGRAYAAAEKDKFRASKGKKPRYYRKEIQNLTVWKNQPEIWLDMIAKERKSST